MSLFAHSLFLVTALAATAADAFAQGRRPAEMPPARTLSGAAATSPGEAPGLHDSTSLLVRFRAGTAPWLKAEARRSLRATLLRRYALVSDLEHLGLPPGLEVHEAIHILERLPFVAYAHPDYTIFPAAYPNDEYFEEQWALDNWGQPSMFGAWEAGIPDADIDGPEAWNTTTTGALVAVLDTGITYAHPDLDANVWINVDEVAGNGVDDDGNGHVDDRRGWDFASNDNNPNDGHGHGSHVAGIVAAEGNNGLGVAGIAWTGKVMAVKVIRDDGYGHLSMAIAGLEYAVANGARISNNSWGYYSADLLPDEVPYHSALSDAIAAAGLQGHLFVAAAGNDSLDTDQPSAAHYPSTFPHDNILSVAATDNWDGLAWFSNFGAATVDLGAPGDTVFSTYKYNCVFGFCDYDYAWLSGTSMAAPHVAGVAALVLGRHPDWTYAQLRDRLLSTVKPVSSLQGITAAGGIVNAAAALVETGAPPAAPTGLTAVAVSHERIDLAWTDNSGDESGFHVERSINGTNWAPRDTVGAGTTTYVDVGLAAGFTYYYRVRAFNLVGSSAYSSTASATTLPAPAPAAPSDLTASAASHARIDLGWADNSTDEDGFHLERSPDGASWSPLGTLAAGTSAYADTTVAPQTTYYYRLRAFNVSGTSAWSNTAGATTPAAPLPAVDVTATGETPAAGTVSGTFADTRADDGVSQSLTERLSNGKPSRRFSHLEHTWTFDVGAGGALTFFADAAESPSSAEDDFKLQYSANGVTYTDLCVIGVDCGAGASLPAGITGTVYVRVLDTDRSPGAQALDTVEIDHMFIRVVPAAP